jgi:NAD(P)-dependent dehydrogenase (short-subunit alcohol dehydrogenase family)
MAGSTEVTVKSLDESRVALVGGTSGVGLATARQLAAVNVAHLVLLGRDPQRGAAAVGGLTADHPGVPVEFVAVDSTDVASVEAAASEINELMGGVDVLVNTTSGYAKAELLHQTSIKDLPGLLNAVALAPILMSRAILPTMQAQRGGCIINLASDAAKSPTPGRTVIGAAMAAIVMFSRTLAIEAKRDGIRVNAIIPSLIANTPTSERQLADGFSAKLFAKAGNKRRSVWPNLRTSPGSSSTWPVHRHAG